MLNRASRRTHTACWQRDPKGFAPRHPTSPDPSLSDQARRRLGAEYASQKQRLIPLDGLRAGTVSTTPMDNPVSQVPSYVPGPAIKLPGLTLVRPAIMLKVHPALSGLGLTNCLTTEKEPDSSGKHPLQNHAPISPTIFLAYWEARTTA